ncbi:hypothetical protein [Brevundimonas sp. TWP2-3-2]
MTQFLRLSTTSVLALSMMIGPVAPMASFAQTAVAPPERTCTMFG